MPDIDDFDFRRQLAEESRWSAADHRPGEVAARLALSAGVRPDPGDGVGPYYELPLTRGYVTRISPADFNAVSQWKWGANVQRRGDREYVRAQRTVLRADGRKTTQLLDRLLLPTARIIDHRNGDPLDNRRANLRPATHSVNCANIRRGGTSEFNGVSWCATRGDWEAKIRVPNSWMPDGQRERGRTIWLGNFASERDAAAAYDAATLIVHGELARPNVPELAGSWDLSERARDRLREAIRAGVQP